MTAGFDESAPAPAWRQRFQYSYLRLIKPAMLRLLKSRSHGIVSHSIMLITFTGRRSGQAYTTPVSYVRAGNTLTFATPLHFQWWRNLRDNPAVEVLVRGRSMRGCAVTIADELDAKVERIESMIRVVPRDAKYYPIHFDRDGSPNRADLVNAAKAHVVVVVELDQSYEDRG